VTDPFVQFGRGPLHKWKNLEFKKAILDAGPNYQFKAAELLKDFDYEEWLDSAEQSDDEWESAEPQGLIIGHTHEGMDEIFAKVSTEISARALDTRSRILRGEMRAEKPAIEDEDEDAPDLSGGRKRSRGDRLIDDETEED